MKLPFLKMQQVSFSSLRFHPNSYPSTSPLSAVQTGPSFDPATVAGLMDMGFTENRCKRALLATGNSSAEAAMEWVFSHMEDAGKSNLFLSISFFSS